MTTPEPKLKPTRATLARAVVEAADIYDVARTLALDTGSSGRDWDALERAETVLLRAVRALRRWDAVKTRGRR